MRPDWPKLASLAQKTCTLDNIQFFGVILASNRNIFNFTTAGDLDCVVTVKSLPAHHHSVDLISGPLGSLIPLRSFEDI